MTKLVVRNVAFEATRRDVQKLFNPFGVLKSCRLRSSLTAALVLVHVRRGSPRSARPLRRWRRCADTHLYGRRLTIERAAEDDDVAGVREKTAASSKPGAAGQAALGENAMKKPRRQNAVEETNERTVCAAEAVVTACRRLLLRLLKT